MSSQDSVSATWHDPDRATVGGGGWARGGFRFCRKGYFAPAVILLLGSTISAAAFWAVLAAERRQIRTDFIRTAGERASVISRAIEHNCLALESTRSFCVADHEGVHRDEFHTFVQPFFSHMAGIQALEWVPCVADADRDRFEAAMRREGFKDFQIAEKGSDGRLRRAARHNEYFPVCYVEPYLGNEPAFGYDAYSTPERREALEQARSRGTMGVSAPLVPVHATDRAAGDPGFPPGIRDKAPPPRPTPTTVRRLRGFVLGVFRTDQIVEDALKSLEPGGSTFTSVILPCPPVGVSPISMLLARGGKTVRRAARPKLIVPRAWSIRPSCPSAIGNGRC